MVHVVSESACVQAAHSEVVALAGFHIKRQEFEPEYDNEAEMIVADMEFKEDDTEVNHCIAPYLRAVCAFSLYHNGTLCG